MPDAEMPVAGRTGVIVNARAGRARRRPGLAKRLGALLSPGRVRETHGPEDVEPALDQLRSAGVDTLMLVGGDGTVHGTLTPLLRSWPADSLPRVVVAPGGTVNTIARSLGARGTPEGMLQRLVADESGVESRRALVGVRPDGAEPEFGLVFINGVGVRWLERYYASPRPGVAAATRLVARIAGSALVRGGLAAQLFEPFEARVEVDGQPIERHRFTAMAAAGVQHVGLGFRPFHTAGTDPQRIHFSTTASGGAHLAGQLPALRLGLSSGGSALTHHAVRGVTIRCEIPQPWSIDAETFVPATELRIEAGPVVRFLQP